MGDFRRSKPTRTVTVVLGSPSACPKRVPGVRGNGGINSRGRFGRRSNAGVAAAYSLGGATMMPERLCFDCRPDRFAAVVLRSDVEHVPAGIENRPTPRRAGRVLNGAETRRSREASDLVV